MGWGRGGVLTLTPKPPCRALPPHGPRPQHPSQLVPTLFFVISNPNPNPNPSPTPSPHPSPHPNANQLVLTLFFVISPFLEVISQTAQAFLPAYATPPATADREP